MLVYGSPLESSALLGGGCNVGTFVATAARLLPFSLKPMPTSELTMAASGSVLGAGTPVCVAAFALADCAGSCIVH